MLTVPRLAVVQSQSDPMYPICLYHSGMYARINNCNRRPFSQRISRPAQAGIVISPRGAHCPNAWVVSVPGALIITQQGSEQQESPPAYGIFNTLSSSPPSFPILPPLILLSSSNYLLSTLHVPSRPHSKPHFTNYHRKRNIRLGVYK